MHILAEFRKRTGISQRHFAERVGVDQSVISKIETGLAKPGLSLAVRIEEATGRAVPVRVWVDTDEGAGVVVPPLAQRSARTAEAAE